MLAVVKILISALLIFLVNKIVVAFDKSILGALIASLPLISILTFIWIWTDLRGKPDEQVERLASHSTGVFWFVIPSLPMFLIFPFLLKKGLSFWPNLAICCVITAVLYLIMTVILKRFGVEL